MLKVSDSAYYQENKGLIHAVAHQGYGRIISAGVSAEYDDIAQELTEVFFRCLKLFDPNRGIQFSTYFTNSAKNRMQSYVNKAISERVQHGVRSFEELNARLSSDSDEGGPRVEDMLTAGQDEPHKNFEKAQRGKEFVRDLSDLARQVLKWMDRPPEWLREQWVKHVAHIHHAVDEGFNRRVSEHMSMTFVLDVLEKLGMTGVRAKELRQEFRCKLREMEAWE